MSTRPPRAPWILLGLMTILTVAGPIAISQTLRGGTRTGWPPDRPLEWWAFGLIIAAFVVLMASCLGLGLVNWRRTLALQARRNAEVPQDDGQWGAARPDRPRGDR